MDTIVKVMDLDVNIMDSDTFNKKVEGYLEDDQLNILLLATSRLFVEAGEKEEFRKMISAADAIVPGEEALLGMYPENALEKGGVIINYQCLSDLLLYLSKKNYTLYMVARNEKGLQAVKDFFEYAAYGISMVGGRVGQELLDEAVINEINGLAPDILLVDLDTPMQEKWIMEHRTKVNTKLCVGLGGIMRQIVAGYGRVPAFLYTLHLDGIYKKLILNSKFMKERERERFKKKMMEYKNKKREE